MVNPKKPVAPASATTSSYLLTAVKILLVVIIILLLPKLVTGQSTPAGKRNKKLTRQVEALRFDCERSTECKELLPEENTMCVTKCLSQQCHEQVYGQNPLEPGEIHVIHSRDFDRCVKNELRAQRNAQARAQ
jgi:hypothetical protein